MHHNRISDSRHDGLYKVFRHSMNNIIKTQIMKSIHSFSTEWVQKADAFITPRKTMYMKDKPGVTEFEKLLNRFGVMDEKVSEKASSESTFALESVAGPSVPQKEPREPRVVSGIHSPWESNVFAF